MPGLVLSAAAVTRFDEVVNLHRDMMQRDAPISQELARDIRLWKQMLVRHSNGDFRHSDAEKRATRNVAQWTVDLNCMLRGQDSRTLTWKD